MKLDIQHNTFHGEADNHRVRNLLSQHFTATRHSYFSVDPPNWERMNAAFQLNTSNQTIHLWERPLPKQPCIVGMVLCQRDQTTFSTLTHPQYRQIESMLVDWVEGGHQATGTKQPLKCSVCEHNETQKAVLTQRGYVQGKQGTLFRQRILDTNIPQTVLPTGYHIDDARTLSAEQLAERTAVENQVFGSKITLEFLLTLQQAPLYRPNLDLVITAPSGHIAAFCTTWFDTYHRVGYVEPIGTVSPHRRLGLGKALLIESFRRLQDLGAAVVYLGHRADNQAGNRLYDSVGMRVFDQEFWWAREF